jgi:hypothetical protein
MCDRVKEYLAAKEEPGKSVAPKFMLHKQEARAQ